MVFSFLLGAIAAWISPKLEDHIAGLVTSALPNEPTIEGSELKMLSFAVALFIAAVLAAGLSHASGIALTLGAIIGVIGPRLMAKWRNAKAPDYDS